MCVWCVCMHTHTDLHLFISVSKAMSLLQFRFSTIRLILISSFSILIKPFFLTLRNLAFIILNILLYAASFRSLPLPPHLAGLCHSTWTPSTCLGSDRSHLVTTPCRHPSFPGWALKFHTLPLSRVEGSPAYFAQESVSPGLVIYNFDDWKKSLHLWGWGIVFLPAAYVTRVSIS